MKERLSLRNVILLPVSAGVLLFGIAIVFFSWRIIELKVGGYVADDLSARSSAFLTEFGKRGASLQALLPVFDDSEKLVTILQKKDHAEGVLFARSAIKSLNTDFFFLVDSDGIVLARDGDDTSFGDDLTGRPSVKTSIDEKKPFITVEMDSSLGLCQVVSNPVTAGGRLVGLIVAGYRLGSNEAMDHYKELFSAEFTSFMYDTRIATTIVDSAGKRIVGTKMENQKAEDQVTLFGEPYYGVNLVNNQPYTVSYIPIKNAQDSVLGVIAIALPQAFLLATARSVALTLAVIVLLFVCFLFILFTVLLEKLVVKPLAQAKVSMHEIAYGNGDLTKVIEVHNRTEIGQIITDVNYFTSMLKSIISDLKVRQGELTTVSESLSAMSVESASSITEILANIESVHTQSSSQLECVSSADAVIDDSVEKIRRLGEVITRQIEFIGESTSSMDSMIEKLNSASRSVAQMSAQFDALERVTDEGQRKQSLVNAKVNEIAEQSRLLKEANDVIAKIASQTNLLAMNAAIEAAHAGESGAGFSVVADEIRHLAETSSGQSKAIRTEIKNIQNSINEVVVSSADSNQAFGDVLENIRKTGELIGKFSESMKEQQDEIMKVSESLRKMKESTGIVEGESTDLQSGTDSIKTLMRRVTEASAMIDASMDEMSLGAGEINTSAHQISDVSVSMKDTVRMMNEIVGKFIVE